MEAGQHTTLSYVLPLLLLFAPYLSIQVAKRFVLDIALYVVIKGFNTSPKFATGLPSRGLELRRIGTKVGLAPPFETALVLSPSKHIGGFNRAFAGQL